MIETITVYSYQNRRYAADDQLGGDADLGRPAERGWQRDLGRPDDQPLASVAASGIYRTLPTIDCTRQIQTCVCTVGVQLPPARTGSITRSRDQHVRSLAPPVTILV